jgi:hypothetical protein
VKPALCILLLLGFARADKKPFVAGLGDSLKGQSKSLYLESRNKFHDGAFAEALALLEQASQLSSDPRLLWNMAACENKLHHFARAMVLVDRYLKASALLISDEERKEVNQFLSAARAFTGQVRVETKLAGVKVFVDSVAVGTTPFPRTLWVDQGDHQVRFEQPGYQTLERSESVPPGSELLWTAELQPLSQPMAKRTSRLGPIVLGAGGALFAVLGVAFLGSAATGYNSLVYSPSAPDSCSPVCPPSRYTNFQNLEITGAVFLSVGAAAATGALIWAFSPTRSLKKAQAWHASF